MTLEKLKNILQQTGFPVAYHHFAENEAPEPPFLVYFFTSSENFYADGNDYFQMSHWNIELYTATKTPSCEKILEKLLKENELNYQKTEVWINIERLYEVLYTILIIEEEENE